MQLLSVYVLFSNHIFMFYLVINLYKGLCGVRWDGGGWMERVVEIFEKSGGGRFFS